MKTKLYILVVSVGLLYTGSVEGQFNHNWSFGFGSSNSQDSGEDQIAHSTDGNGNIYVKSLYPDVVDFDPSAGVANLFSNGSQQSFIAKYDKDGNYVWAKNIPETPLIGIMHLTNDKEGNVLIVGNFNSTTDFDPSGGTANLIPTGSNTDCYIAKYDSSGNYLWAKHLEGTGFQQIRYLTADKDNNLYVTGYLNGSVDLDPSANTANFSSSLGTYFAKYNANGEYVWGGVIDSVHSGFPNKVQLIADDSSLYFKGRVFYTIDANFGTGTHTIESAGNYNHLVLKYSQDGNFQWAFQLGGGGNDGDGYLAVDDDNIYLAGEFAGTILKLNLVDSTDYIASINGVANVFLASYDKNDLSYNWGQRAVGTPNGANIFGLGEDEDGIQIVGDFRNEADFDPTTATYNLTSLNNSGAVYIAKYGKYSGMLRWAHRSKDWPTVNSYSYNNTTKTGVLCGLFLDTVDVDFQSGNAYLYASNLHDMYIATYNDITTGIKANSNTPSTLHVYPNPASSKLFIQYTAAGSANYRLLNSVGQVVQQNQLQNNRAVDVSSLPAGMYYINVTDEKGSVTQPFIISKP